MKVHTAIAHLADLPGLLKVNPIQVGTDWLVCRPAGRANAKSSLGLERAKPLWMGSTSALKPSSRLLAFHLPPSFWMSAISLLSVGDILLAGIPVCSKSDTQACTCAQLCMTAEQIQTVLSAPTKLARWCCQMLLSGI